MIKSKPDISFKGIYKFHGQLERPLYRVGGEMVKKAEGIQKALQEKGVLSEISYNWDHSEAFAILKTGKHAKAKPWYMSFLREPKPIEASSDITAEKIIEMDSKDKGFLQSLKSLLSRKK